MAYTTTAYPASAYYTQYSSQPGYSVEPHPYEGLYTTNAYLQPETTYVERPSSRRTVSPSSSAEHAESSKGHRRRRSSVYLETGGSPSRRSRERELQREEDLRIQKEFEKRERQLRREEKRIEKELSERRQREREREREAAKPETAKPISLPRSSTMPTGHISTETRGRRPILVSEYVDNTGATSARIPLGPVEYVEHASKGRASKRYSSTSGYERPVTPLGYASNEEENYRRKDQRARKREEVRDLPSSAPERGSHYQPAYYDSYGSSAGSSASGFTPPPSRSGHRRMSSSASRDSAAVESATKSLRWADQETRRGIQDQNDRISQRPKLSRSESVKANRPLHTEVKSILKNGSGQNSANSTGVPTTPTTPSSASRPPSSDRRRRESFSRRDVDDLARGVQGLSTEDPEYRRLASRFTRRHSTYGPGPDSAYRTHYSDRYP